MTRKRIVFRTAFLISLVMVVLISAVVAVLAVRFGAIVRDREVQVEQLALQEYAAELGRRVSYAQEIVKDVYIQGQDRRRLILGFLDETPAPMSAADLDRRNEIQTWFAASLYGDPTILDLILVGRNGQRLALSRFGRRVSDPSDILEVESIRRVYGEGLGLTFLPANVPRYVSGEPLTVITAAASLFDENLETVGCIVINIATRSLAGFSVTPASGRRILAVNAEHKVLFDSGPEGGAGNGIGSDGPERRETEGTVQIEVVEPNSGIALVSHIPRSEIARTVWGVLWIAVAVPVAAVVIGVGIAISLAGFLTKGVRTITTAMQNLEAGEFGVRIPAREDGDEIDYIAARFNRMAENLENYIERVYVAEIQEKSAEILLLQRTIDPHFLYNSLESIRVKAACGGDSDTAEMILILSRLVRRRLRSGHAVCSLDDEIEYCEDYLELMSMRHGDLLSYQFEIPGELGACGIPALSLQPIVENSAKYGMDPGTGRILISVTAARSDGALALDIRDRGPGFRNGATALRSALEREHPDSDESAHGLVNVHRRLRMIFGPGYGLSIECAEPGRTHVRLSLPVMAAEEMREHVSSIDRR